MKLRVSFINFLNSVPLGWGFLHGSHRDAFQVDFDVPSRCAERLEAGQADVGLIPAVEYQKIPGLRILPGISIAAKREVKSVLFLSRTPLHRVRRVAVDNSSRTSIALLKVLLSEFYANPEVEYVAESPQPDRLLREYEAALVIGNPALAAPSHLYPVYDLAAEWNRFTGLPFVFAFWAVRPGLELQEQASIFYSSRAEGLLHVDDIARLYGAPLGLEAPDVRRYLLEHLDYTLDPDNLRGLRRFYQLAAQYGLIADPRPLQFTETAAAGITAEASGLENCGTNPAA